MRKSISEDEIENQWLQKYRQEDVPSKTTDHLQWMSQIGFTDLDIVWKYYNFTVYCGYKI